MLKFKEETHGSASAHPDIELELHGVGMINTQTGLWSGAVWVGDGGYCCNRCGHVLRDVALGELCECGLMVNLLSQYGLDEARGLCVWQTDELTPLRAPGDPPPWWSLPPDEQTKR